MAIRDQPLTPILPIALGSNAQRQYTIATGRQPHELQMFEVGALVDLDRPARARVLDIVRRATFAATPPTEDDPRQGVIGYEWLHRRYDGGWRLYDSTDESQGEPGSVELEAAYLPTAGRTITVLDHLVSHYDDQQFLSSVLTLAPLIDHVDEETGHIALSDVLDAYDRAFAITSELTRLVDLAHVAPRSISLFTVTDELIEIRSIADHNGDELQPIGLLRESDPEAFALAHDACKEIPTLGFDERDAASSACRGYRHVRGWATTDRQIVEQCVLGPARSALEEARRVRQNVDASQRYDIERERWISANGSERLKQAAARGYKHDGIYRDERLSVELPGFLGTLGRSKVSEIVNPTAEALTLETETIEHLEANKRPLPTRLVWIRTDPQLHLDDGEFVEVSDFLGRHKVYRPIEPDFSDIPF